MTRDEAMKIMRDCKTGSSPEENWLNAFVALGILKLDEPKSGFQKFKENMAAFGFSENGSIWPVISESLNKSNLKIIDK